MTAGGRTSAWQSATGEEPCGSSRKGDKQMPMTGAHHYHSEPTGPRTYRADRHSQRDAQLLGKVARLLLLQAGLKLFTLYVRTVSHVGGQHTAPMSVPRSKGPRGWSAWV